MICFKDAEWKTYVDASERASARTMTDQQVEAQACLDCTLVFQLESLDKGLCRPISLGVTPLWRQEE